MSAWKPQHSTSTIRHTEIEKAEVLPIDCAQADAWYREGNEAALTIHLATKDLPCRGFIDFPTVCQIELARVNLRCIANLIDPGLANGKSHTT